MRTRASGRHSYRFQARRGRWITIGALDDFEIDEARKEADKLRGDIAKGKDPHAEKRAAHAASLNLFIEKEYEPWALAHRPTGAETVKTLKAAFSEFLPLPLKEITLARVERWRTARLSAEVKPATVNRNIAALRSVFSRAVEFGVFETHPLAKLKVLRTDERAIVRYLSPTEEKRLRKALEARDRKRRAARASANDWREVRSYDLLPVFGTYTDHVTPLVLVAINTGLRRGELFALKWQDIDFDRALLVVRGETAKSGQTRTVNLNREAVKVLTTWRPVSVDLEAHVFAGKDGKRDDVKTAWLSLVRAAGVPTFRFHDLRHTFASKLVMAGVDLNTTRELLGHADLKMTLRYAHLAPAVKAAAVEKLVRV